MCSRSLIDYIMPVKEMLRKMTDRRKYVIISDRADPDYLDDIEETFVRVKTAQVTLLFIQQKIFELLAYLYICQLNYNQNCSLLQKADILWEEMYHFNLEGNLQRGRITRYLQNSTKHLEFPYIFVVSWETFYCHREPIHYIVIGSPFIILSLGAHSLYCHWEPIHYIVIGSRLQFAQLHDRI